MALDAATCSRCVHPPGATFASAAVSSDMVRPLAAVRRPVPQADEDSGRAGRPALQAARWV